MRHFVVSPSPLSLKIRFYNFLCNPLADSCRCQHEVHHLTCTTIWQQQLDITSSFEITTSSKDDNNSDCYHDDRSFSSSSFPFFLLLLFLFLFLLFLSLSGFSSQQVVFCSVMGLLCGTFLVV